MNISDHKILIIAIFGSIGVCFLAVLFIFFIFVKRNKMIAKIDSLRQRFLTLNKTPIKVKLKKIELFIKKEPNFREAITYWNERYQSIMVVQYKDYTDLLEKIIKNLNSGNTKDLKKNVLIATKKINHIESEANKLYKELTKAMEIENIQMIKSVHYKSTFQTLLNIFNPQISLLVNSKNGIQKNIQDIKKLFIEFDEKISNGELQHSAKILELIANKLLLFARILDVFPKISLFHKHIIDRKINEIQNDYKKYLSINKIHNIQNIDFDDEIKKVNNQKSKLNQKIIDLEINPAEKLAKGISLKLETLHAMLDNEKISKKIFKESLKTIDINFSKNTKNYNALLSLVKTGNFIDNNSIKALSNSQNTLVESYENLMIFAKNNENYFTKSQELIKFINLLISSSTLIDREFLKIRDVRRERHIIIQNIHSFNILVSDIESKIKKNKFVLETKDKNLLTNLLLKSNQLNKLIITGTIDDNTNLKDLKKEIATEQEKAYKLYYYIFNFVQLNNVTENAFICANRFNRIKYNFKLNNILQTAEVVFQNDKLAALKMIVNSLENKEVKN